MSLLAAGAKRESRMKDSQVSNRSIALVPLSDILLALNQVLSEYWIANNRDPSPDDILVPLSDNLGLASQNTNIEHTVTFRTVTSLGTQIFLSSYYVFLCH